MLFDRNPTSEQLSPVSRYEFVDGLPIREPIVGRESAYRPWEAPALAVMFTNPEVDKHQQSVGDMLQRLIAEGLPSDTPDVTRNLVHKYFALKDNVTDTENRRGYRNRIMLSPELELNGDMLAIHEKVLNGTATIAEIDAHMAAIECESAELAVLRSVNGYRAEYESMMDAEIAAVVGTAVALPKLQKLQIIDFDEGFYKGKDLSSMAVSSKEECGTRTSGIRTKKRKTFVVRTDYASGFDPEIREVIQKSARQGGDQLMNLRRVQKVVNDVAEKGALHPQVNAAMISAYNYDPHVAEKIARTYIQGHRGMKSHKIGRGVVKGLGLDDNQ